MPFSGLGAGTTADPYQITTLAQLYEVFDYPTAEFLLMNNIDASDTSSGANTQPWNGPAGWSIPSTIFSGVLDGNGFSINNMFANIEPSTNQVALVYELSGVIKNISNIDWTIIAPNFGGNIKTFGGICYTVNNATAEINNCNCTIVGTGEIYPGFSGICYDINADFTVTDCSSNINLESTNGYINTAGGIVGRVRNANPTFTRCSSQFKVVVDTPAQLTINSIGGIGGRITPGLGSCLFTQCKANIVFDTKDYGKNIGGIIGETVGPNNQALIRESWAYGQIIGNEGLGGIVGDHDNSQILNCWNYVDIIAQNTTDVKSGLLGGLGTTTPHDSFVQKSLSYGSMTITTLPNLNYSADIVDTAGGSFFDVFHNSENLGDIIVGASGNVTNGTGLTEAQLQDNVYMDANTSLDFTSTWQASGYNGYMDLQNNLYDPTFIVYSPIVSITINASSSHFDSDSAILSGTFTGVTEQEITSKGIEYGTSTGTYTSDQTIPIGSAFQIQVDGLSELQTIYYRSYVVYNGTIYYSTEEEYIHYTIDQLPIDPIVVEDYIGTTLNSHNIHGSVLVDINGTEWVFGSPREQGINNTESDVNANILKYRASDYSINNSVSITNELNEKLNDFNQIVYSNGFLWTIGRKAVASNKVYLVRIDPDTLEYILFKNPDTTSVFYLSTDSHTANDNYLFIGSNSVQKIDISQLLGIYTSGTEILVQPEWILGEYDHTSQGYALDPNSPTYWDHITKGYIHSYVSDAEYVYAEYASSSETDDTTGETECELHKIRISDMTASGYSRIPKATDDMTQNSEYIFLGIETDVSGGGNNMGYSWGSCAVRKSDMQLKAIPLLHSSEPEGTNSYASTIIGDYLIDQKVNKISYVIDISNVNNWSNIDHLADPSTWVITESIGQYTLKVFELYQSYTNEDTNVIINGTPNEIMYDSNNKFHSFGWIGSSTGAPSSLSRYEITGLNFIGKPIIDTIVPTVVNDIWSLEGFVISDGGANITSVGFEYSQDPDFITGVTNIASSLPNFTGSIAESSLSPGTWYVRAWADNSQGRGYGDVETFEVIIVSPTIDTLTPTNIGIDWSFEGSILDTGGDPLTAVGFEYSKDNTFVTGVSNLNATVNDFTGTTQFTEGGQWYLRAWGENSAGRSYGDVVGFNVVEILEVPTVDTLTPIQNITDWTFSATITDNGNATVTAVGFQYSQDINFNSGITTIPSTVGNFTETVSDLAQATWYVRGYADNSQGRGYGDVVSFTVDYAQYEISGNVTYNDSPIEGATLLLIDQATNTVIETTTSNVNGAYSFSDRSPSDNYIVIAYFSNATSEFTSVAKPFKNFTNPN